MDNATHNLCGTWEPKIYIFADLRLASLSILLPPTPPPLFSPNSPFSPSPTPPLRTSPSPPPLPSPLRTGHGGTYQALRGLTREFNIASTLDTSPGNNGGRVRPQTLTHYWHTETKEVSEQKARLALHTEFRPAEHSLKEKWGGGDGRMVGRGEWCKWVSSEEWEEEGGKKG